MSNTFQVNIGGVLAEVELISHLYKKGNPHSWDSPDDYYGIDEMEWEVVDIIRVEDDVEDLHPSVKSAMASAVDSAARDVNLLGDQVEDDIRAQMRHDAECPP